MWVKDRNVFWAHFTQKNTKYFCKVKLFASFNSKIESKKIVKMNGTIL